MELSHNYGGFMKKFVSSVLFCFVFLLLALPSLGQELKIESFDSTGQLSFSRVSTATT